jgi:hypothetical protein
MERKDALQNPSSTTFDNISPSSPPTYSFIFNGLQKSGDTKWCVGGMYGQ